MAARNAGVRASEIAEIEDRNAALDFDLACTMRLNQWDLKRCEMNAKLIAYEVSRIFASGDSDGDNGEVEYV